MGGGVSGFSWAQSLGMVREGASAVVTDLNQEGAQALADEIRSNDRNAIVLHQDVTEEER
ncbi:MAG: hypothetical protein P1U80_01570 [Pseudomonadales bacterium]|nr:hypothetical protein [Pseudomonadales bacterium]